MVEFQHAVRVNQMHRTTANLRRIALMHIALLITGLGNWAVAQDRQASPASDGAARRHNGRELRKLPVFYRTDGFSKYFIALHPLTKEKLEKEMVDPLVHGGVSGIIWGISAGSRVTFDSKTGQLLGDGMTPEMWKKMRDGDLNAYRNLKHLIDSGHDPLTIAAARAHQSGVKLFAYMHVNKEYGPTGSWTWLLLTDDFSKEHAEYRITGSLVLDFKHKEVRDRKLAILREAAETGVDGVALNLMTQFFADPEAGRSVLTQFIRDVRKMLDEVGEERGQRLDLLVRVPFQDAYKRGIDWKTYMKEGLIDSLSAFKGWPASDFFDVPMDRFVDFKRKINSPCRIHGFIWQALGIVDTDPSPTGKKRYGKPKLQEMYFAQALIHNDIGCDGIELGFASPDQWKAFYGDLGTPGKVTYADKRYMVDLQPYMPIVFGDRKDGDAIKSERKVVELRIADDLQKVSEDHYSVETRVILYCRSLDKDEKIELYVNDKGPVEITAETLQQQNQGSPATAAQIRHNRARNARTEHSTSFLNTPNWWKRGQKKISIPAEWLVHGRNVLDFRYTPSSQKETKPLEIIWVEVALDYARRMDQSATTVSQTWLASTESLYTGPVAKNWEGLKAYTGLAAAERIIGKDRKAAYLFNYQQLGINYGEAVDFQLRRAQVILCPQTVDFLYSDFTPTDCNVEPGKYPALEKVVAKTTADCKSQQEKALALMRFCRDLYKRHPHAGFSESDPDFANYIYGGTDEQLVEKPEILCECLGRLVVALCEIAGMPGRIVMHDIGGHICSEILIDGHWAYLDPRCGMYFLKPDGKIASVLELCQTPSIIRAQPDHVKTDVSRLWTWHYRARKCENMYFHPKEVNGFQNYSLNDTKEYCYQQLPRKEALAAGLMDVNKKYVAAIHRVFDIKPDGKR